MLLCLYYIRTGIVNPDFLCQHLSDTIYTGSDKFRVGKHMIQHKNNTYTQNGKTGNFFVDFFSVKCYYRKADSMREWWNW